MSDARRLPEQHSAHALRGAILALFFFSAAVLLAELFLLEHTETTAQLVPIIATAVSVPVLLAAWLRPGRATLFLARLVMLALLVVGMVGTYLHYQANVEFELEMHPDRSGWLLFWDALHGAMPALAPGLMAQLGLLGLAFTFMHPALRPGQTQTEEYE